MWGWIGSVAGIVGGIMVALKFEYSKFGYIFFMLSAITWTVQSIKNKDTALILLNIFFILINILGLYRWFS